MLARISEMLFVDAVRRYVEVLPPDGRMAGGTAHRLPAADGDARVRRRTGLDELGRRAGLSRSALHERLRGIRRPATGAVPHSLAHAARIRLLRSSNATATIAQEVGYDSQAAFARAFKGWWVAPPAAWRRALAPAKSLLRPMAR